MAKPPVSQKTFHAVSMTGFGRASVESEGVLLDIEMKTVNSRFLDLSLKTPRSYSAFESFLRELLSSQFHRGRVELYVTRTVVNKDSTSVLFHAPVFEALYAEATRVAKEQGVLNEELERSFVRDFLLRREVLEFAEEVKDEEKEKELLQQGVLQAVSSVKAMRETEGEKLAQDLLKRVGAIEKIASDIEACLSSRAEEISKKFKERVESLVQSSGLEADRLEGEVALLFDRIDITEEIVRLKSHCEHFREIGQNSPNGRKLDFLLQEIGRELNTVASKAQHSDLQRLAVDGKSEMERMKEQVQNLE